MIRCINKIYFLIAILMSFFACDVYAKFAVQPVRIEEHVEPGGMYQGFYSIRNYEFAPTRITLEWFDATRNPADSEWFSFEKELVDVPANATVDVAFTVRLPEDAQGLYYARIRFSENPPEGSAVGVSKRYNYPLLIVAQGTQSYDYSVHDVNIQNADVSATTFQIFILNKSNTYIRPAGSIVITPKNDTSTEYRMDFNTGRELILPQQGSICTATFIGDMLLADGDYTAHISINTGAENTPLPWYKAFDFSIENGQATIKESTTGN